MPKAAKFREAFGLPKRGDIVYGWKVVKGTIGHRTIVRFRKYEYPIHFVFKSVGGTDKDTKKILKLFRGKKIVPSEYGNPYECWIELQRYGWRGDEFYVDAIGYGVRIYKENQAGLATTLAVKGAEVGAKVGAKATKYAVKKGIELGKVWARATAILGQEIGKKLAEKKKKKSENPPYEVRVAVCPYCGGRMIYDRLEDGKIVLVCESCGGEGEL